MKYDNNDALKLIYFNMRWGQFLEKYWHKENVVFVHAKAIAKAYEKVHPIPVKTPSWDKFQRWIAPFKEKCKISEKKLGESPATCQIIYRTLFKDYMDNYARYLYKSQSASRDYDLEFEYSKALATESENC